MTIYAHIVSGAVAAYPYSIQQMRTANPQVSFPRDPTAALLAAHGVLEVADTPQPAPSSLSVNVVEAAPVFTGGAWRRVWQEVAASAQEIASRTKSAAQTTEFMNAQGDAWIVQFLAMTPDEAKAYIESNSATLAALRTNVARLAYAVRVLIRREFNT